MTLGCKNRQSIRSFFQSCDDCGDNFSTKECFTTHLLLSCKKKKKRCRKCWALCPRTSFESHECGRPFCSSCKCSHSPLEVCTLRGEPGKEGAEDNVWDQSDDEGEIFKPGNVSYGPGHESTASEEEEEKEDDEEMEYDEVTVKVKPEKTRTVKNIPKPKNRLYADVETVENPVNGDLKANLVIVQKVVDGVEAVEEFFFRGPSAMKDFAEALVSKDSAFKNSLLFFHNGSR